MEEQIFLTEFLAPSDFYSIFFLQTVFRYSRYYDRSLAILGHCTVLLYYT